MKSKFKLFTSIAIAGATIFSVLLAFRGLENSFQSTKADISYSITLNNKNRWTSGSTKKIDTDSKKYQVAFAYNNCSSYADGHVTINNEGTVKNADHILSITSVYPKFTCSNTTDLKFRASYDGTHWGDYAVVTSEKSFDLSSSKPYYVEFKAFGGSVNLESLLINYECVINQEAESTSESWELVTDNSDLELNKQYIITDLNSEYGLSKTQNTNNRAAVPLATKALNINNSVQILTLLRGNNGENYSLYTGDGYLAAQSGDNNYLWTNEDLSNDASWYISIDDGDNSAFIQSRTSGVRDLIRFNPNSGNPIFSCYNSSSANMQKVLLYKKTTGGAGSSTPVYATYVDATDASSTSYKTDYTFADFVDAENGMNVKLHFSNGSSQALTYSTGYTYEVKTSSGTAIDPTQTFPQDGNYTVTITDKTYGFKYSYSILVGINPVTSISLNISSISLLIDEQVELIATVLPETADDKTITWSSSDTTKATVDQNGVVTAVSMGLVNITATANGGNGVIASCSIKVKTPGAAESIQNVYDFTQMDISNLTNSPQDTYYDKFESRLYIDDVYVNSNLPGIPITDGGDIDFIADSGYYIKSFSLVLRQYEDNSQNVILYYYDRNSEEFIETSYASSNFYFSVGEEYFGDKLIDYISFYFETYNEVGIVSLTVDLYKPGTIDIPVTGMSLSPATATVLVGGETTITPTIVPAEATNKNINWTSSNTSVATVSNGVVSGVSEGKATITATTVDGGFVDTCEVTVNNRPVTSLTLNKYEATIYVGDKDLQLNATINSDATIQTLVWESSDTTYATVDNSGKVHAVAEGVAIITVTADGGVTATCTVNVRPASEKPEEGGTTVISTSNFSQDATMPYTIDGITLSYAQNGAQSPPIIYRAGTGDCEIRIYSGNTFTISGSDLTSISFVANECGHDKTNGTFISCSKGSLDGWVWTSNGDDVDEVMFTASSSGQVHIAEITIETGGGGGVTPTPKPTLSSISVSGPRTSFTVGDTFSFGGVCTAIYSDNSEKTVEPTSFTGYNMNSAGHYTVTVSYKEDNVTQTTTYAIDVESQVITLTDITVTPSATTFTLGDPFSKPTVMAKYSDGSSANVTNDAVITGYNGSTSGKQTVTVSYTENSVTITKTYTIEVIDPEEATTGKATIVPSDLMTSYPGSEAELTKSNMTFGYKNVANMNNSGVIQFKKQIGYIRNTVAINGLRSIEVVVSSGKAFYGTIYSGLTADNLSHTQSVEESGTYYIESGDKFFKLEESGTLAGYLDSVTVNFSTKKVNPTSVYFDQTSMELALGEQGKLVAKFTPDDCNQNMGLTWTSSNPGVATVTNGTINALAKGTTTITATSTYNSSFKATCLVTVKDIAVQSVTLDSSSISLNIGATQQLYATVNPSNATNKNVTWTTTNSTVASVSSTGLVTAKAVGNTTIKVSTQDGGKTASCYVEVSEQKEDKWTIMLYICGADLESDGGYATSDLKEILSTKNKPDDVNVIVQTGGTKKWSIGSTYLSGATKIDATKTQRWHVEGSKLVLDSTSNLSNFGSSNTFKEFLTWGTGTYPAQKTGVIMWDHGGGIDGLCWDENNNDDCLSMKECKDALSGAFGSNPSKKLEWIGYDACLMQCQEIADYNSKYFNYMVASEESESGYGWDYDKWLDNVYAYDTTPNILKEICYTFLAEQGMSSDQTLSYLNLAYMDTYKSAWESFASALSSTLSKNKVSKNTFKTFVTNNVKYYSESGYCGWGNIDAKDFVNKVAANSSYNPGSTYTNAVLNAFSNLVAYSRCGSDAGNSYGLCCVYKIDRNVTIDSQNCGFTNWISFNNSYGG